MELKPTAEQSVCIELSQKSAKLKVSAFAGAAKTTTLSMIAKANMVKSLYLAFNKSMADEARHKFPEWVETRTTHSLAYAAVGHSLKDKLSRPKGAYRNVCGTGREIAMHFKIRDLWIDENDQIKAAAMGLAIKETVNRFEYSADKSLQRGHVSFSPIGRMLRNPKFDRSYWEATVLDYAKQLWKMRIDERSPILATHDTYLKLYQLSEPDLGRFEIVYLDEAQDSNDCVMDIVSRQGNSKLILVGDEYQQIYAWRGSVNAMKQNSHFESANLSASFRFGQPVASIANAILELSDEDGVKGLGESVAESSWTVGDLGVHTALYRTNSALLIDAIDHISNGVKVNLEIDVGDFVRMLESAVALHANDMKGVKHEELLAFDTWPALEEEVKNTSGALAQVVKIVSGGDAGRVLGMLSTHKNVSDPDIILTTAHKSKGREWHTVRLADDFPSVFDKKTGEWIGLTEEERNLLYVAATRAKKRLVYNGTVNDILTMKKLKGGY